MLAVRRCDDLGFTKALYPAWLSPLGGSARVLTRSPAQRSDMRTWPAPRWGRTV